MQMLLSGGYAVIVNLGDIYAVIVNLGDIYNYIAFAMALTQKQNLLQYLQFTELSKL